MAGWILRIVCMLSLVLSLDIVVIAQARLGSLAIQGTERTAEVATVAMPGSGSIVIQGWEQSTIASGDFRGFCEVDGICPGNDPIFDSGTIILVVNGYMAFAS